MRVSFTDGPPRMCPRAWSVRYGRAVRRARRDRSRRAAEARSRTSVRQAERQLPGMPAPPPIAPVSAPVRAGAESATRDRQAAAGTASAMEPPPATATRERDRDGLGRGDAVAVDVVDDLVLQDGHEGEGVARSAGRSRRRRLVRDVRRAGRCAGSRFPAGSWARAAATQASTSAPPSAAATAAAMARAPCTPSPSCVYRASYSASSAGAGGSRMHGCQHRRAYAGGVVEEVRVVVARGGRAEPRREVAEPGPHGDAGPQGQHRRLHLGCPSRPRRRPRSPARSMRGRSRPVSGGRVPGR